MSDIDRVMGIIDEGRAALRAAGVDQWQGGYPYRETIEADIARGESYVVETRDGCMVATVAFGVGGKSSYDCMYDGEWLTASRSANPEYLTVHRLAVTSEGRGRGVAAYILDEAKRAAREGGMRSVRIDTHPDNAPMRRSLEKAGFSRCGLVFAFGTSAGVSARIGYEALVD